MRIICYDSNNNPLKRFYQWDTNQTISISGIIMPPVPVFHFCNRLSQSALVVTATVEGNVIKAPVPNALLEQAETIVVYMYEETPNDGSRTTHTITIPVIPRPKPNDYNYIDNIEYPSYAMLDARINEILASMGDEEGGLAELSDMRIGVDGTKYQTAGEAMRSQFSEVVQAREDKNGVKYVALKDRLNAYQDEVEALSKELHYNYQNLSHIVDELINVNLDDYKTAGTYRIRSASDAETIQNIPENVAGRLTVMATTESGRVLQTYITNSSTPRMYVRFFNGTEWKEWDKFASSSEVNSLLEDLENISNGLNQNYQNLNNTVEELTNGNLDDYKTAGNYKVLSADIAKTIQNIPEAIAGRLTVMVTTQTNRTLQIYVTNASTPKVYIRYFNGTKWNSWNSFANKTEFKNYESLNHVDAEEITSGNLDDYKTPGSYKIRSASNAATIQNIPEAIAGRLTVMATTESGRVLQTYITNSSTPRMYVRFFNGTEWKEWDKFASGAALDKLSEDSINATNYTVTPDNYTNYFTDYNDIPVNTVCDIAGDVPLLNSPPGNTLVDRDGETTGYIGGVVVTFSGKSDKSRSVLQIFSSRSTSIEQTFLCFRMAYPVSGVLQWSPWQKMSNSTNLTASNIAIRKEISTRFFSDFNDAPINSIYQIDLDCDEGTLANHPNPGCSCVLVTLGFSPTSRHGMVQLCFGMTSSVDHALWYRYGYKQSADEYRWTKWNKVGDSSTGGVDGTILVNKGRLVNGTDLNSVEENAIYLLSGSGDYLNTPSSSGNGFLTTKTVEGVTQQIYDKFNGESWSRYKTSSSEWSEWVEGSGSQESIADLIVRIQENASNIEKTNSRIDELESNSDSELAAQVNQNKTDILSVKEDLTQLESFHTQTPPLNWIDGYVKADGSFNTTNADWKRTDFITIKEAKTIKIKGTFSKLADTIGYSFAFYDGGQNFIGGENVDTTDKKDPDVLIPDNAEYMIISNQVVNYETVEIEVFGVVNNADNNGIYTAIVGAGEQYESVTDAVASAKSGDRIFVKSGVYDNEHIEAWGKDIAIIGETKSGVIIQCSDSDYANPCIEFSVGLLENLTFKKNDTNTGYVLHCEDDFQYGKNLTIKNCDFISPKTNAVGMGMRANSKIIFKDCGFYNTKNQGSALYLHDSENDSYTGVFDIDFDSCVFSNLGNYIVQFQSQEKANSIVNFGFRDCTFYGNGSTSVPFISTQNHKSGTSTNAEDFEGLINWRLKKTSKGNNLTILNILPTYSGSKS